MASPDDQTSDSALISRRAECLDRLSGIDTETAGLQREIAAAQRSLPKSAAKLGVNAGLGVLGIVLSPPTLGLSLLVTVGSGGMLLWDGYDISFDYFKRRQLLRKLRHLRAEQSSLAAEGAAITATLNARQSG
jgi:hypothetical protein